jgi:hypothetical protein
MNEIETSIKPQFKSGEYRAVTNKYSNVWCDLCGIYVPFGDRVWWNICTHKVICEECGIEHSRVERENRKALNSSELN